MRIRTIVTETEPATSDPWEETIRQATEALIIPHKLLSDYQLRPSVGQVWAVIRQVAQVSPDGRCRVGMYRLAELASIERRTAHRALATLIEEGYVVDHTPDLLNCPHELSVTDKIRLEEVAP